MGSVKQLFAVILLIFIAVFFAGCGKNKESVVVVYVSEDQVFSEPILRDFEKETGIRVKAVYDTEEAKSTGVMNRLIGEKGNPQADVYWANEPDRAELLKEVAIVAPYLSPNAQEIPGQFKDPDGYWTGFSARARVLLVNKNAKKKPVSMQAYTDPRWKGKAVIANPLFGTTTDLIAAVFSLWGDEKAKAFMDAMKKNQVKISTSNGESADWVAQGQFDFSIVDSDDANNRIRQNKPVEMIFPDQGKGEMGTLILPNVALLIKGAPHPDNAKRLIDYLLSKETERKLAFADCAQIPLHPGVEIPPNVPRLEKIKVMAVDYRQIGKKTSEIQPFLKTWVGY